MMEYIIGSLSTIAVFWIVWVSYTLRKLSMENEVYHTVLDNHADAIRIVAERGGEEEEDEEPSIGFTAELKEK